MTKDRYMSGAVCPGEVYSLAELEAMPTVHQGQYDDLKIDSALMRLWHSRLTVEDGARCNNLVTIEEYDGNSWNEVGWYEAI